MRNYCGDDGVCAAQPANVVVGNDSMRNIHVCKKQADPLVEHLEVVIEAHLGDLSAAASLGAKWTTTSSGLGSLAIPPQNVKSRW